MSILYKAVRGKQITCTDDYFPRAEKKCIVPHIHIYYIHITRLFYLFTNKKIIFYIDG